MLRAEIASLRKQLEQAEQRECVANEAYVALEIKYEVNLKKLADVERKGWNEAIEAVLTASWSCATRGVFEEAIRDLAKPPAAEPAKEQSHD